MLDFQPVILGLALFILAPFLGLLTSFALLTSFLARGELRRRRLRRAVALFVGSIAVEGLAVALGVYQITYVTPAHIDAREVPGTYVLLGRDARDEIVLSPDGTFARTASYRGVTQLQHGRWRAYSTRPDFVDIDGLEPSCLRSTEPPGTTFHYREPNEAFCTSQGGGIGASLCRAGGQLAFCLGDEGLEFIRR